MRKTAILRDSLFLAHDPGFNHPDSPDRLKEIYNVLDKKSLQGLFVEPDFIPVSEKELYLNHSSSLVKEVAATSGQAFGSLEADTTTSPESYNAACLAVGALVKGVDLLMGDEVDNCFALVRPPGHHAEKKSSMGFCLFNNVAIAASYAMKKHNIERIMIIDWDLHHGNGTQTSFFETNKILYVSTHQYPFYPGTGSVQEIGRGKGEGYTINIPLPGGQGDKEYAAIFNKIVVPLGRQYKPQLIFVSSGFDIYHGDPLGSMQVTSKGFGYMTKVIVDLAEEVCEGRVLVTLEGGYNLTGQRDGALAVLSELYGAPLDTGYPINLDDKNLETFQQQRTLPPFVEQSCTVAKKYWKM